ncbi:MAG TPA: EamA family transporter [Acidobacteriaceae bacterium]|jgi:drug/metabolite transporter (DMT)-like permease
MPTQTAAPAWKTLLAFGIIYIVWGSTFLAIRVGVRDEPPLLLAGTRFVIAGLLLFGWMAAKREALPNRKQWTSIALLALLIFVFDYGLLFWAERRVPSGVAAVVMATIPVFTAIAEITLLRTQKLTVRLAVALLIGLGGVAVLMSRSLGALHVSGAPVDTLGALALLGGSVSWSIASVLNRKLVLPASKGVSAGAQMLLGGSMLSVLAVGSGELHGFHVGAVPRSAWLALLYLIVAGSLIGFTAYVWLIHHQSPTKVGTYAYVNPVVAVVLGYFFASEPLGLRTVLGTLFVLVSVIVITTTRPKPVLVPGTVLEDAA